MYKYDLHCHTREGSVDAKLGIVTYALMLKNLGFSGMLVTDHNSYRGYNYFNKKRKNNELPHGLKGFRVFKGIEYDSGDAGHVIIILPDGEHIPVLEVRGLDISELAEIVHRHSGIIGAAHPFGIGYFAITNTRIYRKNPEIMRCFDFVEGYNSGLNKKSNRKAVAFGKKLKKPMTSGSDSHNPVRVGSAFTVFDKKITDNNSLIEAIKCNKVVEFSGKFHLEMTKKKNPMLVKLGIVGYVVYNKVGKIIRTNSRRKLLKHYYYEIR